MPKFLRNWGNLHGMSAEAKLSLHTLQFSGNANYIPLSFFF